MATTKTNKSARPPKLDFNDVGAFRRALHENQTDFWRRFGMTQSAGSRYESGGRPVPTPLRALMVLYATGVVDDTVLADAIKAARRGTAK